MNNTHTAPHHIINNSMYSNNYKLTEIYKIYDGFHEREAIKEEIKNISKQNNDLKKLVVRVKNNTEKIFKFGPYHKKTSKDHFKANIDIIKFSIKFNLIDSRFKTILEKFIKYKEAETIQIKKEHDKKIYGSLEKFEMIKLYLEKAQLIESATIEQAEELEKNIKKLHKYYMKTDKGKLNSKQIEKVEVIREKIIFLIHMIIKNPEPSIFSKTIRIKFNEIHNL